MHLGKVILMLALGATFVHLGELLRLDGSSPWRPWWIAGLAAGAGLLSGLGLGEAALLAAGAGAAVALQSSAG